MKQIFISLLFLLIAQSYASSQTVVKLLLPDNCSENTNTAMVTATPSAIDNLQVENSQLQISPNPSNGNFVLSLCLKESINQATIQIFSIGGEVIYTEKIFCDSERLVKQIGLKNILSGSYIIKITSDNIDLSNKLIIK